MDGFKRIICSPGARGEIQGVAPTQLPHTAPEDPKAAVQTAVTKINGYSVEAKKRRLDRWLDWLVQASGSEAVFFTILAALLIWALLGIHFRAAEQWQVVISDVQAILSYTFDSLLMRQQLNGHEELMMVAAQLRSRKVSHERMLKKLVREVDEKEMDRLVTMSAGRSTAEFETELPHENWFGRTITSFSHILGHIITIALFWVAMIVWLGFGHRDGWGNIWLLDVNSATSALMVLVFSFLANIRERHAKYTDKCLDATFRLDAALELKLRLLTGDDVHNEGVIISAPKVNVVQRAINFYADVVGTLVGVALLIIVIIIWIVIGPALSFSANWWLIIGTYAGLVGMNDGFVLRNVQGKLRDYEIVEYVKVEDDDKGLYATIKAPIPEKESVDGNSLSYRVSAAMNRICAHEITVALGLLVIIALVIVSSAMRWDTTGQLISNVPPSIIESFFMIILITGHNHADVRRRIDFKNIYERRLRLFSFVNTVDEAGTVTPSSVAEKTEEIPINGA